jgi:hypothetical protein
MRRLQKKFMKFSVEPEEDLFWTLTIAGLFVMYVIFGLQQILQKPLEQVGLRIPGINDANL